MGTLSIARHGQTLHFDDTGFSETPYVYRPLTQGRLYEEPFLEYVRSLGRVGEYVDVGAHLGTHTIWFAKLCPATRVHAFEPVSRYAAVLRRNIAANALEEKITLHQVGLAAESGRTTNYLAVEHQIGFTEGSAEGVTESFDVLRLDEVVQGRVAAIKVDVEGMESEVLRGAGRILSEHRPVVFVEALSPAAFWKVERVLAPFGYRPTWRIFNASPTYEFSTEPVRGWQRVRAKYGPLLPVLRAVRTAGGKAQQFVVSRLAPSPPK